MTSCQKEKRTRSGIFLSGLPILSRFRIMFCMYILYNVAETTERVAWCA